MKKSCPICGLYYKEGELVSVTVIAPWHEIRSSVTYSLGKPVDTVPHTLKHYECNNDA